MRLWSVSPQTMCRRHLLGEHVETHMMVGSIVRGKSMEGFYDGLIDTRLIRLRHDAIVVEMLARGYQHNSPLPEFVDPQRGRLNGGTPQERCEACRVKLFIHKEITMGISKQKPAGNVRPLGTTKKEWKKKVDSAAGPVVGSVQQSGQQAIPQAADHDPTQEKQMTLTFKSLSKNGKTAFYTGAATVLRFALSAFPDKRQPESFDVADWVFAGPKTKVAKSKMTKEERAALPKPTLAERIARRREQLAKDEAKLAAQSVSI